MSRWLEANAARFNADILRDFCIVSAALEEQFERFDHAGNLSFSMLRDLLGDQMDKGLLWRLKDTAHLLLRDARGVDPAPRLLDWAIGYIFHETIKLLEDTHQHQHYAPRLSALVENAPSMNSDAAVKAFVRVVGENSADMRRGVERIRLLLAHARGIFHRYCAGQDENRHLARLLHDREQLIRAFFGEEYEAFIAAVYNGAPEQLYLEAAAALLDGGRFEAAVAAAYKAADMAPHLPSVAEAVRRIENAAGNE